jgi:hypothetical protein
MHGLQEQVCQERAGFRQKIEEMIQAMESHSQTFKVGLQREVDTPLSELRQEVDHIREEIAADRSEKLLHEAMHNDVNRQSPATRIGTPSGAQPEGTPEKPFSARGREDSETLEGIRELLQDTRHLATSAHHGVSQLSATLDEVSTVAQATSEELAAFLSRQRHGKAHHRGPLEELATNADTVMTARGLELASLNAIGEGGTAKATRTSTDSLPVQGETMANQDIVALRELLQDACHWRNDSCA